MSILDLFDKKSLDSINRKIAKLVEKHDKKRFPFECSMITKKKKEKPVEIGLSLLIDQYGYSKTILFLVRDITRRKEAEKNLIQRAEELQKVFDAVPSMLFVIDENKRVKKINLEGVNSIKKEPKQIIGKKIGTIINCQYDTYSKKGCGFGEHCSECPINENILRCLKNDKSIRDVEVSLKSKRSEKGYLQYFQLNAIPLQTHGKRWSVVSMKDITARKQAEIKSEHLHKNIEQTNIELKKALDDLAQSQSQLIESQKLQQIGLLSSGLAHNLKTPTAGIKGYAQLLHKKFPDSDEVNMILDEVEIINNIINDLMLKNRKEHSYQQEEIDINEVVRIELSFLRSNLFFKHKVKKVIELDDNLPLISGVYTHFSQSLMNIIQNSIDAMLTSEKKIFTLRTYFNNGYIYIEVRDTGIGIPDKIKKSIFEPFFTTKSADRNDRENQPVGTGLGLSSASYFIRQYGGDINVESTESIGTNVTIKLPYKTKKKDRNKERVIIIDESQEMVDIFVKICRDMGLKAEGTTEIRKADKLLKETDPALLIMDLSLKDSNLKEFTDKVRQINPEQKVIFMQGYTELTNNLEWLAMESQKPLLSSIIKKPFSLDEFKRLIQRMLF